MQVFLFWRCSSQSPPLPGFCDLSARTYFKDTLHFRRIRCLGSFKNRHDSVSFSFVQLNWLPITNSCSHTEGTNTPQSLWNSFLPSDTLFWTTSWLVCQGQEISLQRAAFLSTDRNEPTRTLLTSLAPCGKETLPALCEQVLTFTTDSLCSGPQVPFPLYEKPAQTPAEWKGLCGRDCCLTRHQKPSPHLPLLWTY